MKNQFNQMNSKKIKNQFNQMNINNMNNIKGIKNYSLNMEASYINSVLQSLSSLDTIKNWFEYLNNNNNMNDNNQSLTKELYLLLNYLYNGNKVDSSNIIISSDSLSKSFLKKVIKEDPYHFLIIFLELLHIENNRPINPNFDKSIVNHPSIEQMKNKNFMYTSFGSFFQQTQNSIISQCFFNVEQYKYKCSQCPALYLYTIKKMFIFDIDNYRIYRDQANINRIGTNLTLDECFQCYSGGHPEKCKICHFNGYSYRNIFSTTKVLILYFKRNSHIFKGDIDFTNKYNFCSKNYSLKACISYCNIPKYFCDICINNVWYRYMDDNVKILSDVKTEIHEYEPQLLIYELNDNQNNIQNNIQNNNQINNQNIKNTIFINPFNNNINQMMANNQYNNNFIPFQQYQQMLMQMKMQQYHQLQMSQMLQNINLQVDNRLSISENLNNENNNNEVNKEEEDSNPLNATITFLIVPKDWDKKEEGIQKILPQLSLDDTLKKSIDNFFIKLQKPREAINEFIFNDRIIDTNSTEKLKDFGLKIDSKILAIKSDNFDTLKL